MTLLQKQQYFALPPLFLAKDNPCWLSCQFIYVFTAGSLDNKLVLLLLLFNFRQHLWIQLPHHTHTETHVHVCTSVRPSIHPSILPSVLSGCVVALTKSSVAIVWLCYCDSLLSCLIDFSSLHNFLFPWSCHHLSRGRDPCVSRPRFSWCTASLWWSTPRSHFLGRGAGEADLEPVCGQVCL